MNNWERHCDFTYEKNKCDFKTIFALLCNSFLREMSEGVEKWLTHFQRFITKSFLSQVKSELFENEPLHHALFIAKA